MVLNFPMLKASVGEEKLRGQFFQLQIEDLDPNF